MAENNNNNNNTDPNFDEIFIDLDNDGNFLGPGSARRGLTESDGLTIPNGEFDPGKEIENLLVRLNTELSALNSAQLAAQSAQIDQSGRIFFDAKLRPLVDTLYFLALSTGSVAATANIFSNNVFGKKRELKQALDLTYKMNEEIECIFNTFRKVMKQYRCGIEKEIGCCTGRCNDCEIHKEYDK